MIATDWSPEALVFAARNAELNGVALGTARLAWGEPEHPPGRFDLVLAADRGHERALIRLAATEEDRAKVRLLRSFDPGTAADDLGMADPWWGDDDAFERTYAEVRAAVPGVVEHVRAAVKQ